MHSSVRFRRSFPVSLFFVFHPGVEVVFMASPLLKCSIVSCCEVGILFVNVPFAKSVLLVPFSEVGASRPVCEVGAFRPVCEVGAFHPVCEVGASRPVCEVGAFRPICEVGASRPI